MIIRIIVWLILFICLYKSLTPVVDYIRIWILIHIYHWKYKCSMASWTMDQQSHFHFVNILTHGACQILLLLGIRILFDYLENH